MTASESQATADPVTQRRRPDRGFRYTLAQQTPTSAAVAVLGSVSLLALALGTFGTITAYGWTPSQSIAAAIQSTTFGTILGVTGAAGLLAAAAGWGTYRRLPTRGARDGAITGAVLGVQAALFAAFLLWFRAGDVETFARNFLEFDVLEGAWSRFLRAMWNTVVLAVAGEAIGIAIGIVFAVFALSRNRVVRAPVRAYVNFFRGTPLLWQLSFFFFGVVLGLRIDLNAYQVAILVLALNAGAYSTEIFRAGIQSIERGQFEAARSLGMTHLQALRYVIVPQAFRRVIPPLTNEFVILIKDTSLVSVLGLTLQQQELMAVGRDLFAGTFNATPFLISAAGYLAVTLPMIRAVTWLEGRLRSGLTGIGA